MKSHDELRWEVKKTEITSFAGDAFLYYALPTHFQQLSNILKRMLSSSLPEVVWIGAKQACLLSLTLEEARPLAGRYISLGTAFQCLGAARISSSNLLSAQFRPYCENVRVKFFNDPYEEVRVEAARCFHAFKGDLLGDYIPFVEAFVQSAAF